MRPTVSAAGADRPRVLLCDPHEQGRVLLARLLVNQGFEVVASVPNYAQALVGARREGPTVIVTELYGGTILSPQQYVAALRRHSPAPIIALSTVLPSPPEIVEWGLWAALPKGGRPARLLETIARAHRAVRERAGG